MVIPFDPSSSTHMICVSNQPLAHRGPTTQVITATTMFGSKTLSLPPPFSQSHQSQHMFSEPARLQPSGQCHFPVLRAGLKEQRCSCQGYQQNRSAPSSICDCTHAACHHAQNVTNGSVPQQDNLINDASLVSTLWDRIRRLEEMIQTERELRESAQVRDRQSWERDIRVLREALTPFYQSEQDMQRKLVEIEDRLDRTVQEQTNLKARVTTIEKPGPHPSGRVQGPYINGYNEDQRSHLRTDDVSSHDPSGLSSVSEPRTSISAEPMSPRQPSGAVLGSESPRSSGILNLVGVPRPAMVRHTLPPRLSPTIEPEEPRSSGFLGVDVKELIQRRKFARSGPPVHTFNSPSSTTTRSPSNANSGNATPPSLSRMSPPNIYLNGHLSGSDDRAYKKRKNHNHLMALDVLADVSAASPVIS